MVPSSSPPRRPGTTRPQRLFSVIGGDSALSTLYQRGRHLLAIEHTLWPLLPVELRPHTQLANYRDATLFFVADSPVWAARMRHLGPQILHTARARCKIAASRVKVFVQPAVFLAPSSQHPKTLSMAVRHHLRQVAAHADSEFAQILERIANRPTSE